MKFYDVKNSCLVFIENLADEKFWADMWEEKAIEITYSMNPPRFNLFLNMTKKYRNYSA